MAQSSTFGYTGVIGSYTVPVGVYSLTISASGAQGGNETVFGTAGGNGATMTGNFAVTPGHVLNYMVGQQLSTQYVGGGGGGTFLWDVTAGNVLFVAAGGGGGASIEYDQDGFFNVGYAGLNASVTTNGVNGTYTTSGGGAGGAGASTPGGTLGVYGGGGAGWTSNGAAGAGPTCGNATGGKSPLGAGAGAGGTFGGNAGYDGNGGYGGGGGGQGYCYPGGGGGGGGYSGGGGGGFQETNFLGFDLIYQGAPGGGGGSYILATASSPTNSVTNTGNGSITICAWPSIGTITVSPSTTFCPGTSATLSTNGTASGTWTSVSTGVATITATTVTGVSNGTSVISYTATNVCGTAAATTTVTISGPATISGTATMCIGNSTSLSDATTGGTWSTTAGTGSVSLTGTASTTATATGTGVGTATVTYSTGASCSATKVVTVTALPGAISGTEIVCIGNSTSLSDATAGGTWTTTGGTGSISLTGTSGTTTSATGSTSGTATITYSLGGACYSTGIVTVTPLPGAITGTMTVCTGLTTNLTNATTGGSWSTTAGSGSVNVGSGTGVVTGVSGGTATVTYSTGGVCYVTTVVTVTTSPAAITGTTFVCSGSTTALTDVTTGGTWSSSTGAVGTVGTTGIVAGISGGTTTITYSMGASCYTNTTVTVYALPSAITGTDSVCIGSATTLTDAIGGGTWTSSNTNATVGGTTTGPPSTAAITGAVAGTSVITYATSANCYTTTTVSVFTVPTNIIGANNVCQGSAITLNEAAVGGGSWTSSNTTVATIGVTTTGPPSIASINGVSAGTATITYSIGGGACFKTKTITVTGIPDPITGSTFICSGLTSNLTDDVAGGTWSSSNAAVATVGLNTGIVTGGATLGTATITYSTNCGTAATIVVTVTGAPGSIAGNDSVCVGLTTNLTDAVTGGTWSSSAPATASVGSLTGIVTGNLAGTATISYSTGCTPSVTVVVTVNPNPTAITGTTNVCVGLTTTLNSTPAGGTWTSSNGNATINPATGIVTGAIAGTSTITYTLSSGCIITTPVTVNPNPTALTGTTNVCVGLTTTLNSTPAGGTWTSSNGNATIDPVTGIVTGAIVGTSTITYTISTGCINTTPVTVNPNPTAFTGTTNVCVGLTTTLNSTPAGGTWTSSNGNATIAPTTGVVTGAIAGTSTITYTIATGCLVTGPVTVNPNPTAITGINNVCVGLTTTLNSTPAGGTWTSSNGNATVAPTTGVVTGAIAGTSTITYTISTGCIIITPVTVNANPTAFTGTTNVCVGLTTTLNSTPAGGTWTSSNGNATIDPVTGIVTGAIAGTSTITYTVGTGCLITGPVTVNPNPTAITGTTNMCVGLTTTLNSTPAGGTWTSSNGNATVAPTTGVVTGAVAGTSTITYTISTGCIITTPVTVNPNPTTITGLNNVCVGLTTSLNSTPAGGTWTSSNGNATVDIVTGVVTGSLPGTSTITYTLGTGCIITTSVTVNPNPTVITGTTNVCVGLTTSLNSTPAGGTWTSSNGNATVNITTGLVTGAIAGNSTITYMLGTGCISTTPVTVNATPTGITGITAVCVSSTTTLNSTPAGGTWTSSNGNATINSSTGVVTGSIAGTSTITYMLSTGCLTTTIVTVNASPGLITGALNVCVGLVIPLTDAGGGGWSSSSGNATVDGSGNVTGVSQGTSMITYTLSGGCISTAIVTVNPNPSTITGINNVCVGLTTSLNSTPAGGTWTSSNGNATVNASTGVVTGSLPGTSNITYTLGTGCIITTPVTVNPNPTTITGTTNVCVGLTTSLNSTPAGGTWTSSNGNATINAVTGVVTGSLAGTSAITYTLGTGCLVTAPVTVNANPTTITGTTNVCVGLTTSLNSTPAGGTWTSSNGNATVNPGTGVVTGSVAGTSTITYTLSTGCINTTPVTVNPNPTTIIGTINVCVGLTTSLNSTPPGGNWTSSNGNAIINPGTGVVTGSVAGTSMITYTLGTGCLIVTPVTVNPNPTTLTGTTNVCVGLTTTLNSTPAGGTWTSSNGNAIVNITTGIVTGSIAGTATITYTLGTGCINTTPVTVNPNPTTFIGTPVVCVGSTTTLNSTPAGGTWTSSNGNATIDPVTGVVTGAVVGTSVITYTISTGCINTEVVTVNTTPTPITGTTNVCVGLTTTLNSTPAGGTWISSSANAGAGFTTGVITGVTAGTAIITYSLGTGCQATTPVTVNPNPTTITGTTNVCVGLTTTLNSTPAGGTWGSSNGNATINSVTGIVTGSIAGTSMITYTLSTGCIITTPVTVNPNPTNITGTLAVCVGLTTSLNSTPAGGTWTSSNGNATVVLGTGVVTGAIPGTSTITYTLGTGCINTTTVTVNANPTPITGIPVVCVGLTTTLNSTPAGGTWTSSNGNATVASSTGIVTGSLAGTSTITYTLSTGCIITTPVTVNPLPTAIIGTLNVCVGSTTSLTDAGGGTWSMSNGNAIVTGTGVVTGIIAGTDVVTYTLPTSCITTAIVTINPLPASITGTTNVCSGFTTALTDVTTGGTWSSSATGIATVGSSTGIVTGGSVLIASTAIITYTLATGCIATTPVTVNPLPVAISGIHSVCVGLMTTLTDASGGGTWISDNPLVGTIGSTSGIVTGITAGTTDITYTLPTGCIITTVVTVNALPGTIAGTLVVCAGLTTTLTDAPAGGTWSSSATGIATVGSSSGIVTGGPVLTTSTATITYTVGTGCIMTAVVTVNPLPTAITGTMTVCAGLTTQLTDLTGGGTWSSSNAGIASIGSSTGLVTGGAVLSVSTATITYTLLSTGCITTTVVTVNPLPTAITGTPVVCVGLTTTLNSTPAGGTWSSSASGIASVGLTTGVVTGGSVSSMSTATITYTLPTTCIITTTVTVNPLPTAILGTLSVCAGLTTALTDAGGGTWSMSNGNATVTGAGIVTGVIAGTDVVTYTLPTSCIITAILTVNPLPGAILGTLSVCQGLTTNLSDATPLGTWTSSNTAVASVSATGVVTGTATGPLALTATITYTLPTGCMQTAVVTVNPLPVAITGTTNVCSGLTTTLNDATTGGTWLSSNATIASVGSLSGVVTGGSAGTAIITYELPTGCLSATEVTVNPLPAAITGIRVVCAGLTTLLSDVTTPGTWSSSATGIASIGSLSGLVTGGSVTVMSVATITYTIPTGCIMTTLVTVNPLPVAISGSSEVCYGLTTNLADGSAGGTWSSNNTNAIIGINTGVVTGNNVGTSIITYTLPTSCIITRIETVNPLPATITGIFNGCVGQTNLLSDATTGGIWSSSNTAVATVGSSTGGVRGVIPGTVTITYTLPTGCIKTVVMTINPQPAPIMGADRVCYGQSISLTDATPGGTWSSSNITKATVGSAGLVTGVGVGSATISYTLAAGCSSFDFVTVNPLPVVYDVSGGGSYCEGGAGVPIYLSGSNVGISYLLFYDSSLSATGYLAGTGSPLNFGLLTVAGTYTVLATDNTTGCTNAMLGSAFVIITPTVTPTVGVIASPGETVCPGTTVTLNPLPFYGGPSPAYVWSVNGVVVSVGNSYTYIPANGDIVSVKMTSDSACASPLTATGKIIMNVIPDAAPLVSIAIDPGDTTCQYATATFTATPTFGGTTPVYIWYLNGVVAGGPGPIFSYYPTTGDVVYCKMVSNYQCRTSDTGFSNVAVMTVSPMIVPHVSIASTQGFNISVGEYDTLIATATNAGPHPGYQWELNGVPIPGATLSTYISQFNNYDSITCVVTSSGVCDGISTFDWIYISVYPAGVQQYTFGNGDIRLMPNPNNGTFTVKGTLGILTDEEITLEVTNMIGQTVYSSKVMVQNGKLNEQIQLGSKLANGMYLLNLKSGSDNRVFHFVIEQ